MSVELVNTNAEYYGGSRNPYTAQFVSALVPDFQVESLVLHCSKATAHQLDPVKRGGGADGRSEHAMM